MKNYLAIICFTLFAVTAVGQTQPIEKVEIETDPIIMDSYDYATGRMNDVKWMFKLTSDNGTKLGFEHKLGNSLSINATTKWFSNGLFNWVFNDGDFGILNTNVGLRHYFKHEQLVRSNQQGNNFNGKYIEFGTLLNIPDILSIYRRPTISIGLQSRFLKYGLIDTGIKMAYNIDGGTIRITSGFELGLAFSAMYDLKDINENKCAVVKCFDEQFYMFKTQISKLMDLTFSKNFIEFRLQPNLELEHRISRVGLSMNHELSFDANFRERSSFQNLNYVVGEAFFRSDIRWYVGKKRRIIKGKTSNNLSGFYLGPIADVGILAGEYRGNKLKGGEFWSLGFNLGYQTRLLRNLYIKINAGAMYREYFNSDPLDIRIFETPDNGRFTKIIIDDISELKLIGELVVGYAF